MSEVGFLVGREVLEVRTEPDGSSRIVFELGDEPAPALYADVAGSVYEDRDGTSRLLADMVGSAASDTSTDEATLVLSFTDGRILRCEPHPAFEAWEVVGGTPKHLVVCPPGGGELAVWDSSYVPSKGEAEETIDRLNEMTGWNVRVREVSETGGILVEPEPIEGSSRSEPD